MPAFYRDDNAESLVDAMGLHEGYGPTALTTSIVSANTGAAVAEISLSTLVFPASESGAGNLVRITVGSANDALYAFGSAGLSGSFSGITNMALIPKQWDRVVRIDPAVDKSFYHLQVTGATQIQVMVLR